MFFSTQHAGEVELAAAQGAQASSTSSETLGIELDAARQKESLAQEQIAELQRELQAAQAALSESAVQAAKDGEAEMAIAALRQDLQTAQESKQTVQKELEQARLSQDQAKEELCKLQGHLQELTSPDSKSAQELQDWVNTSQSLSCMPTDQGELPDLFDHCDFGFRGPSLAKSCPALQFFLEPHKSPPFQMRRLLFFTVGTCLIVLVFYPFLIVFSRGLQQNIVCVCVFMFRRGC